MKHENVDKLDAFSKYKLNSLNPDEQPQMETQSIGHQHCCIMSPASKFSITSIDNLDPPTEYYLISKSSENQPIAEQPCHSPLEK